MQQYHLPFDSGSVPSLDKLSALKPPPRLSELSERHGLEPILARENIQERPGQLRYLEEFLSSRGNAVLWADTNAGKTYALLIGAIPVLNAGGRVLDLTPTVELTAQGMVDAAKVLNFEGRVCTITGAEHSISHRAEKFNDKKYGLIFATPEVIMNDIMRGEISLEGVGMIILDEADRLIEGKDGDRKNVLYKFLRYVEQNHPHVRLIAASATIDPKYFLEFMELLRAGRGFRMESGRDVVPHKVCTIDIDQDPQIAAARRLILRAGEEQVKNIIDNLIMIASRHRPMSQIAAQVNAVNTYLAKTALAHGTFSMPAQSQIMKVRDDIDVLKSYGNYNDTEQRFLNEALVRSCALQHIRRHYANLTTSSKHTFARSLAGWFAQVNFLPPDKDQVRSFHRGLYTFRRPSGSAEPSTHEMLVSAFRLVTAGTAFEVFADRAALQKTLDAHPTVQSGGRSGRDRIKEVLLDFAGADMVKRSYSDHPKEDFLFSDLKGWFSRSAGSRVIIFTELADTVKFLVERVNQSGFFPRAVALAGREHMGTKQRTQNIDALRSGNALIGICTNVLELGVHVHGTDLVVNHTPPVKAKQLLQRIGRVTPHEGLGYSMSYVGSGTQDEPQLRAALSKAGEMRRKLPGLVSQRYIEWE